MTKDIKVSLLAVVLILLAACCGYVYGGNQRQKALDRQFQLLNYSGWATEVKANVQLLDLMKAKKYRDAEDLLERFLDVRLDSLGLYDSFAKDHPDENIFLAIDAAREHRARYPGHVVNPKLEKGVTRALGITEKGR